MNESFPSERRFEEMFLLFFGKSSVEDVMKGIKIKGSPKFIFLY